MQACVFLWIGFICAISFMEAWLKFRAPGVTLPIGLGIGELVFTALNRVEWVFAVVIACCIVSAKDDAGAREELCWYAVAAIVLIVQTAWLLPALNKRAGMYLVGQVPPPSLLHGYFIGGEVVKVTALLFFGLNIFKTFVI